MPSPLEIIHTTQIDTLGSQPFIQLRLAAAVSWVSGYANTPLSWGSSSSVLYDPYSMWSATVPSRITPVLAGYYLVISQLDFDTNATSGRDVDLKKNGNLGASGAFAAQAAPALTDSYYHNVLCCSGVSYFNGTSDYFEVYPYQTTGANLNINSTSTKLTAIRIHN